MALIIVESPTKARTFNRILKGQDYFVFATVGHFRDLPSKKIAIDYKNNFKPEYELMANKEKVTTKLLELLKSNNEIILATDPDREGEAIAYHVAYILGFINENWPNIEIKNYEDKHLSRIVFHEITQKELENALSNPTKLRIDLVKAQQARRILDRIVGYEISPILWKKTKKFWLSAGRVQTVALRIIVEREKEILKFEKENYYQIFGSFKDKNENIEGKLVKIKGNAIEVKQKIKLFSGDYEFIKTTIDSNNLKETLEEVKNDTYKIIDIQENEISKFPPPPFTTSLLQQDAYYKFRFASKYTMRLAQNLYEKGFITYHRTDSFNLSSKFVFRAKDYIEAEYGKEYALEKPRGYRTKSRTAQEAHEAIRPTYLDGLSKIKTAKGLTSNHKKLFKLIFDRAVATQMKEATAKMTKIVISGKKEYEFTSDNQLIVFDGFLKLLNPTFVERNKKIINAVKGSQLDLIEVKEEAKETNPPPRYTEGTLIRILEEKGIGRPSTYAPIISLIQTRGYVEKDSGYLIPSSLGIAVSDYLSKNFSDIFEIDFTANMEEELDKIADGESEIIKILKDFYNPFKKNLTEAIKDEKEIKIDESTDKTCPKCSKPLNIRFSKFGKFYACSGYPECKYTESIKNYVKNKKCPLCSSKVVIKYSKKGMRFFGCDSFPTCRYTEFGYKKLIDA
ncbi:MAG: type I DNA topoisomerase [bacterium]|nr:type I DNA topoisomerase [bacterium]